MNSKQLANVLIKILGVSVIVHEIPVIFSLMLTEIQMSNSGIRGFPSSSGSTMVLVVLTLGIGVGLVLASRNLADWLMGSEDEQL